MRTEITSIEHQNDECVRITAIVYVSRHLPEPKTKQKPVPDGESVFAETEKEYQERAKPFAENLDRYNNLHIGWAELHQDVAKTQIPHMEEYWS